MRRTIGIMAIAAIFGATVAAEPAQAGIGGLGGLAKTVLGGGAVLQRSADTCPNGLTLNGEEQLALSLARQAAQSALPGNEFLMLDTTANSNAVTASQKPGFCTQTSKRKDVMMKAIRDAARKLATARLGL
jgi:hypothetical protein